jgi:hypothetical protein
MTVFSKREAAECKGEEGNSNNLFHNLFDKDRKKPYIMPETILMDMTQDFRSSEEGGKGWDC